MLLPLRWGYFETRGREAAVFCSSEASQRVKVLMKLNAMYRRPIKYVRKWFHAVKSRYDSVAEGKLAKRERD